MIRHIYLTKASGTDPYFNMGLEEYLLMHCPPETCILYLWQNEKTVVIGRNQNAYGECRTEALEADGGRLARRLSGGGAVFHDLGNLNFTFLVRKDDYDLERQSEVVLDAVKKLGACAERTGRNDITIDGRKFSGNAYYQTGDFCYHHGTLLLDADKEAMSRYLSVSARKLQSQGVSSVKSRVMNLAEVIPDLKPDDMAAAMRRSFSEVYGLPVRLFQEEEADQEELRQRTERFASWQWKYGRKNSLTTEEQERFSWGEICVQIITDQGKIKDIDIYTDAIDTELVNRIKAALAGAVWNQPVVAGILDSVGCDSGLQTVMKQDVVCLMKRFFL